MRTLGPVLVLLALATAARPADVPRGPSFGKLRLDSEIRNVLGENDEDVFTAHLIAGERVKVSVKAAKKSGLLPELALIDANGDEIPAGAKTAGKGRKASIPTYTVVTSALHAVRLRGAGGSEGAYGAKFRVKPPKPLKFKKRDLSDGVGTSEFLAFGGVDGATVDITVKTSKKSTLVEILRVVEPDGTTAPNLLGSLRRKGNKATVTDLVLSGGAGMYGVLVGIEEGESSFSAQIKVTPPDRPSGKLALSPDEPFILATAEPAEVPIDEVLGVATQGVTALPPPTVLLGGAPATLQGVFNNGSLVDVMVPGTLAVDDVVSVTVIAADGQAFCRDNVLRVLERVRDPTPPPVDVDIVSITPSVADLMGEDTQSFEVTLDGNAPPGGATVFLTATNGIGTLPPTIVVPQGSPAAGFLFTAADITVAGLVMATLDGDTVSANVSVTKKPVVDPPDTLDISNWSVTQQSSTRTFTFPSSTVLTEGDYVVIGRNVTKSDFERFWGVTLGSNVHYFQSTTGGGTEWPTINGGETYTLRNDGGTTIDGATIAMLTSAHQSYARTPGAPVGVSTSWTSGTDAVGTPTPGSGQSTAGPPVGLYISEFSDAAGAGNFPHEFVELFYPGDSAP